MFNWIRNWHINRQRLIFKYWDGKSWQRADPIVLFRGLRNHKTFNLDTDLEQWDMEDPLSLVLDDEGHQRCVKAVCDVFKVHTLSQKDGLTEMECGALLKTFIIYVLELKKSFSLMQTNSESTQPPLSSSLSDLPAAETDTNSTAACTSTYEDRNGDSPAMSQKEPSQYSLPTPISS